MNTVPAGKIHSPSAENAMRSPAGTAIQRLLPDPSDQKGALISYGSRPSEGVSEAVSVNAPVCESSGGSAARSSRGILRYGRGAPHPGLVPPEGPSIPSVAAASQMACIDTALQLLQRVQVARDVPGILLAEVQMRHG